MFSIQSKLNENSTVELRIRTTILMLYFESMNKLFSREDIYRVERWCKMIIHIEKNPVTFMLTYIEIVNAEIKRTLNLF